jgi:hypothetical protein
MNKNILFYFIIKIIKKIFEYIRISNLIFEYSIFGFQKIFEYPNIRYSNTFFQKSHPY